MSTGLSFFSIAPQFSLPSAFSPGVFPFPSRGDSTSHPPCSAAHPRVFFPSPACHQKEVALSTFVKGTIGLPFFFFREVSLSLFPATTVRGVFLWKAGLHIPPWCFFPPPPPYSCFFPHLLSFSHPGTFPLEGDNRFR